MPTSGITPKAMGKTPKGVPGVMDKVSANITPKDRTGNKGGAGNTKMYKKSMGTGMSRGRSEASSGEVGPTRCKQTPLGSFKTMEQPSANTNLGAIRPTKFVN
jgi:hypothetical protein